MDYSNFMYNMNSNSIVNDKMSRVKDFKASLELITEQSLVGLESIMLPINTCKTNADYASLISLIPCDRIKVLPELLSVLNVLALRMCQKYGAEDSDSYKVLQKKFKEFESIVDLNKITHPAIDNYIDNIGNIVATLDRVNRGITTDYVYYIGPSTKARLDSAIHSTIIEGTHNVDDDACKSSTILKYDSHIMNLINETDADIFIAKMDEIYKYLVTINGNYTDSNCEIFTIVVSKAVDMVIDNITGKEKLLEILSQCDEELSNRTDTQWEDNINLLISHIEDATEAIAEYPGGETSLITEMGLGYIYDIIPKLDSDLEANINSVVSRLNEVAESKDMVAVLNESVKDSIKERIEKEKEKRQRRKEKKERFDEKKFDEKERLFDATKDTRVDIDDKRQRDDYDRAESRRQIKTSIQNTNDQDKYELKQQKRQDNYNRSEYKRQAKNDISVQDEQDKYDLKQQRREDDYDRGESGRQTSKDIKNQNKIDKYNLKQQKRQDKVDFKQQKKLDKWEQKKSDHNAKLELKEQKRQERLAARQARRDETKIGINRWKTLELTNSNARKAANAVRKAVKCVGAAGVGALAGVNPIMAGSTYLIKSYVNDAKHPEIERRKLIDDIKQQQIEIQDKINQAEANGEHDKKRALMKMEKKLDQTLKRCSLSERFEADI